MHHEIAFFFAVRRSYCLIEHLGRREDVHLAVSSGLTEPTANATHDSGGLSFSGLCFSWCRVNFRRAGV